MLENLNMDFSVTLMYWLTWLWYKREDGPICDLKQVKTVTVED